eukprot:TRINITY_DN12550_c0_g1_i10.p2 TRINITY_DN12550_c0_g1~~TRINITY_DN12550_c0_g1_i10.p2  ORF type:complete len:113 (+),score=13.42 TRINITY_DN12550_c0_g1_i10:823-1161(+)
MIHWSQGILSGKFARYDYGLLGNLQHYQQATPPEYEISQFPQNLRTVLFSGGLDGLADPADVKLLLSELPPENVTVYARADYGHLDPLLGYDAKTLTYPILLSELKKNDHAI